MIFRIRKLICLLLVGFLSGCTETCIDPDDFGFEIVVAPSRYKKEEISGNKLNQIVPWVDTKLYTNGKPISVFVRNWKYIKNDTYSNLNNYSECSAWSPWYGVESEIKGGLLSKTTYRLPECIFEKNEMCHSSDNGIYAKIQNAPCLLKKGIGLYGLMSKDDPNKTNLTKESPEGKTFHIGQCSLKQCRYDNKYYKMKSIDKKGDMVDVGGIIYDPRMYEKDDESYNGDEQLTSTNKITSSESEKNNKIYLKIVDTHYEDNSGQYIAVFKSGFSDQRTNFFESTSDDVKKIIFGKSTKGGPDNKIVQEDFGIVRSMYNNIVKNSSFRFFAKSIMIIYVIIYGALISIGAARLNQFDILSRLTKIILISILISDLSIDFFSTYLLSFFWDGAYFFKNLALGASGESNDGGDILSLVFSIQVLTKLAAIVLSNILGIIYILIFYIAMIYFCYIIFQTYVKFVSSVIILGLVISLSPVYICLMLFGVTKRFFDTWIRQASYYTILPLFLFIGIGITSKIIKEQMYISIGFPVCRVNIFSIPDFGSIFAPKNEQYAADTSILSWVVPKIAEKKIIIKNGIIEDPNIPYIPIPYTNKTKPNSSESYAPYELIEQRYPDLPYLDIKDPEHVKKIISFTNGNLTDFSGLAVICVCLYLLNIYIEHAENIAKSIGNAINNSTSIGDMAKISSGAMNYTFDKYLSKGVSSVLSGAGSVLSKSGFSKIQKIGGALKFAGGIRRGIKDAHSIAVKTKDKYLSGKGVSNLIKKGWNRAIDKLDHKIFKDNENILRNKMKKDDWKPSDEEIKKISEYNIKNSSKKSIEINQINFKAKELYEKKIEKILEKAGKIDVSYKEVNKLTDDIIINESQKKRALIKYFAKQNPSELRSFLLKHKYGVEDQNTKVPDWIKNDLDGLFDTENKKIGVKINKILTELNLKGDLYDRAELKNMVESTKPRTKEQMEILKVAVSEKDYKIIEKNNKLLIDGKKSSSEELDKIKGIKVRSQGDLSNKEFREYLSKYKEYNTNKYDEAIKKGSNPDSDKVLKDLKRKLDLNDIYSYDKEKLREFLHEQKTGKSKEEINYIVDTNFDHSAVDKNQLKDILDNYNIKNLDEKTINEISSDSEKLADYVKSHLEDKFMNDLKNDDKLLYNNFVNTKSESKDLFDSSQKLDSELGSAKDNLDKLTKEKDSLVKSKADQNKISEIEEKLKNTNDEVKKIEKEVNEINEQRRKTDEKLAKATESVDNLRGKTEKEFSDSIDKYILNQDSLGDLYERKKALDSFKEQYISLKTQNLI